LISELLERAWRFIVTGQSAYGGLSIEAYWQSQFRTTDIGLGELAYAIEQGDYLRVADIIKYVILPCYQGDRDVKIIIPSAV